MTKGEIYDEQISPLMKQIIAICKEHKIANICTFSLDLGEGLTCDTFATASAYNPPEKFRECVKILKNERSSSITIMTAGKLSPWRRYLEARLNHPATAAWKVDTQRAYGAARILRDGCCY